MFKINMCKKEEKETKSLVEKLKDSLFVSVGLTLLIPIAIVAAYLWYGEVVPTQKSKSSLLEQPVAERRYEGHPKSLGNLGDIDATFRYRAEILERSSYLSAYGDILCVTNDPSTRSMLHLGIESEEARLRCLAARLSQDKRIPGDTIDNYLSFFSLIINDPNKSPHRKCWNASLQAKETSPSFAVY